MLFTNDLLEDVGTTVPGAVAAVVQHNEIVHISSVGKTIWATNTAMKPGLAMHLGSCTKAMTALLICNLIDKGMLSFSSKLKDIFSDITSTSSDVTVRHLLNHTSGLVENLDWKAIDALFNDSQQKHELQRREVVRRVLNNTSMFNLSTKSYQYSNVGYVLLGAIIEVTLKIPWETAMETLIFAPLGMRSAGFGPPSPVLGHTESYSLFYTSTLIDNPACMGPAGTVHCSVPDWAKFIAEVLYLTRASLNLTNPNEVHENRLGVSVDTFKDLLSLSNPAVKYSGGWIIADRDWAKGYCLTHAGSNNAWYANVWIAPHLDTAYLVAINAGGSTAAKMSNDIISRFITKKTEAKTESGCSVS